MKLWPIVISVILIAIIGCAIIVKADDSDKYSTEQNFAIFKNDDLSSAKKYAEDNHGFIRYEVKDGLSVYVVYYNETVITHTNINFVEERI